MDSGIIAAICEGTKKTAEGFEMIQESVENLSKSLPGRSKPLFSIKDIYGKEVYFNAEKVVCAAVKEKRVSIMFNCGIAIEAEMESEEEAKKWAMQVIS